MTKKIVWINGAFGAGKTALAAGIVEAVPNTFRFDPELVGSLLRRLPDHPQSNDFQDAPLWRRLVVACIENIVNYTEVPLIVPMTIVNPKYYVEIIGSLTKAFQVDSYFLDVPEEVLASRITSQVLFKNDTARDIAVRAWRLEQISRCVDGRKLLPREMKSLDGTKSIKELVHEIVNESALRGSSVT